MSNSLASLQIPHSQPRASNHLSPKVPLQNLVTADGCPCKDVVSLLAWKCMSWLCFWNSGPLWSIWKWFLCFFVSLFIWVFTEDIKYVSFNCLLAVPCCAVWHNPRSVSVAFIIIVFRLSFLHSFNVFKQVTQKPSSAVASVHSLPRVLVRVAGVGGVGAYPSCDLGFIFKIFIRKTKQFFTVPIKGSETWIMV